MNEAKKQNPAVEANGQVFQEAYALLDELSSLRKAVLEMSTSNNFSTQQRIEWLNSGIALVPKVIEYINNSTNAIITSGLLLADYEDHINELKNQLSENK